MADRYEDRNFVERAGDEVRSWFGRDDDDRPRQGYGDRYARRDANERYAGRGPIEAGYESAPSYRHGRDRWPSGRGFGEGDWARDWTVERWERPTRWSGERPPEYGAAGNAYRAWHERDDRYVAPGDYQQWTRQGLGWTPGREARSRGFYEDDRGRVYRFEHGTESFAGRGPKGYRRSDERIREDVCDRLTDDGGIDATEVEVVVNNCEVTLSGVVNSRGEKRRAEDLVEDVPGVRDVHNNLRVNTSR